MVSSGSPSTDLAVPRQGVSDPRSGAFPFGFGDPLPSASPPASHSGATDAMMPPGGPGGRSPAPALSSRSSGPPEQPVSYTHRGGGAFPLPASPPAPGSGMTLNPHIAQADPALESNRSTPISPSAEPGVPASPPVMPAAAGSSLSSPHATVPPAIGSSLSPPLMASPDPPGVANASPWPERDVPASAPPEQAPPALDGFCCVTLVEQEKWVKGDVRWGAVHRGQVYLFAGEEQQRRFLADFDRYAPALSGYDAVRFVATGTLTAGKRTHGVFYRGQVYLFADEAALQQFWSAPERYAAAVRGEEYRQAAPGRAGRPGTRARFDGNSLTGLRDHAPRTVPPNGPCSAPDRPAASVGDGNPQCHESQADQRVDAPGPRASEASFQEACGADLIIPLPVPRGGGDQEQADRRSDHPHEPILVSGDHT